MDVKERRPYCSLTKSRRDKERRYTNSSADNDDCRVPTQKSYSSSETLKAFDHDSSRLLYGNRVKDLVHREADEYNRQGTCSYMCHIHIIHLLLEGLTSPISYLGYHVFSFIFNIFKSTEMSSLENLYVLQEATR